MAFPIQLSLIEKLDFLLIALKKLRDDDKKKKRLENFLPQFLDVEALDAHIEKCHD